MRLPSRLSLAVATFLALSSLVSLGIASTDGRVTISGQVVDSNGAPVAGARVEAVSRRARLTTHSDNSGTFKVVVPLKYDSGVAITASDAANRMGMTWLPATESPFNLEPRKIQLTIAPLVPVEILVRDSANQPVSGARVAAEIGGVVAPVSDTDALGKTIVRVPQSFRYVAVCAYKAGRGLGLKSLQRGIKDTDNRAKPFVLQLEATGKRITIRAKSDDGLPVAGFSLRPWLIVKPRSGGMNLRSLGLYSVSTDSDGIAHFDDLPAWTTGLTLSTEDERSALRRFDLKLNHPRDPIIDITIPRTVSLSGRVQFADAAPAAGIAVEVSGAGGRNLVGFYDRTISRADGTFTIDVYPDEAYLIGVDDQKWAARALDGIVAEQGIPVENLTLTLRPPTRVHGRVAVGRNHKPVADQYLELQQLGTHRPRPENGGPMAYVVPSRSRSSSTNSEGRYQFDVGPGHYKLQGPRRAAQKDFEVTEEAELNLDFDLLPEPEMGPVLIKVIDAATGHPVPHASISGIPTDKREFRDAVADESGQFRGDRKLVRTILSAQSPDRKSAGFLAIGPDAATATIKLRPNGKAVGHVVKASAHTPFANAKIHYQACVPAAFQWRADFGADAVTDNEGNFELKSLVAGVKYDIRLVKYGRRVGVVTVGPSETRQLGTLMFDDRSVLPSLELKIADALAFDPQPQYLDAQAKARLFRQRVALLFIDPNSPLSRAFMKSILESADVGGPLREYRQVVLDATSEPAKALAKSLSVTLVPSGSLPQLVVRDAYGGPVATHDQHELFTNGEVNEARLVELLSAHANEPLDARQLIEGAVAQAGKSNRRVLIVHSWVNCGECVLMAQYLDATRAIWEKDYILVRIDPRWKHGKDVVEEIQPQNRGPDPWIAILDANASVMITSNFGSEGKGVGYPRDPDGIEHFMRIFKETSQRLSDDDLWSLRVALDDIPSN